MAYWRLHYHLVWTTYKRAPMITPERERVIYRALNEKAKELGLIIHAIGSVEEHIHVVASIPPKVSLSECLRHFKGANARGVNTMPGSLADFKWQEGYGVLSIGERSLPAVIAYARTQKQHHRARSSIAVYERMAEEDDSVVVAAGALGK